jgi:hypothetical protein
MPDQEEHRNYSRPESVSGRIISYNLSEGERPGGTKVRYKIRIVSGPRAAAVDARQAEVIMEVAQWAAQHRKRRR